MTGKGVTVGNILGTFGNDNIRNHHITYFEKKIIENKEHTSTDISSSPNYYAWLCIMAENIFWLMRHFCFTQSDFEQENLTLVYNNLVEKFVETIRNLNKFTEDELVII